MTEKKIVGYSGLTVPGFRASGISCGVKKKAKLDLALILSDVDAEAAGLFTTNRVKAAPVLLDMERISSGKSRGVVVNSGNANACTGKKGYDDSQKTASLVEKALGLKKGDILVCSTGVIGVPLPIKKIESAVPRLVKKLDPQGLSEAASAILTTDAFEKTFCAKKTIGGRPVTIAGIAKGAGMIAPDMATMLAFFFTDACIKSRVLGKALREAVDATFNSIMVDNDTSTNDTVLAFANGQSGCAEIKAGGDGYEGFAGLLKETALKLAHMIVRDGEGATKFVEIEIRGATSAKEARRAVRTIAGSMLVKTAFFGGDPNWGRLIAALGRAGVSMDQSKVDIFFGHVPVVKGGLDAGNERRAAAVFKKGEFTVRVELNRGKGCARLWTSDLGYDYVRINSSYRT
ncbi:MAG: bifunctional glutamate N-acetyltransferase/amino-acid acetyltransferase ArgJ [Thermodesulfobacteriota bacterium]